MLWVWCMQQLDLFVPSVCHWEVAVTTPNSDCLMCAPVQAALREWRCGGPGAATRRFGSRVPAIRSWLHHKHGSWWCVHNWITTLHHIHVTLWVLEELSSEAICVLLQPYFQSLIELHAHNWIPSFQFVTTLMCDWWVAEMNMKDGWRSVWEEVGGWCVMMTGMTLMQWWCVDSLEYSQEVGYIQPPSLDWIACLVSFIARSVGLWTRLNWERSALLLYLQM